MKLGIMAAMVQKDRYVRIGRGMYKASIAGDIAPRAVIASLVRRPMMLCVMAVLVQKDSCSGMCKAGFLVQLEIPQLQFIAGRRLSFRAAETALHGPALSEDHRDFAIAEHGYRRPCCSGRAGFLPVVAQWPFYGPDCSSDLFLSQLQYTMAGVPVVQVELFS